MITKTGTSGSDHLAGGGDEPYLLQGLGGNDIYTLRLFQDAVYQPYGEPTRIVYLRDKVVEAPHAGIDTVTLVNHYGPVGFTGIYPGGSVGPSELANIEIIRAAPTVRVVHGERTAIGWTIRAGSIDNTIIAPLSSDHLDGGAGNDRILAGAGDDTVNGGAGNDYVDGQSGADRLAGGAGNDKILAGTGNDTVSGGLGADQILGGSGNDTISGGVGADHILGQAGADVLRGGAGRDYLNGGAGFDYVSFSDIRHAVTAALSTHRTSDGDRLVSIEGVIGGHGSDHLTGANTSDILRGGAGSDVLTGLGGNDQLYGDAGNDRIYGSVGNDRLYGGAGNDTLDGGTGNNLLSGDAGNDRLIAGLGRDQLYGGAGNDTLQGGAGNALLSGDAGNDTLIAGRGIATLAGGQGIDTFHFTVDRATVYAAGTTRQLGTVADWDTSGSRGVLGDPDAIEISASGSGPISVVKHQVGDDTILLVGKYLTAFSSGGHVEDNRNYGTIVLQHVDADTVTLADFHGTIGNLINGDTTSYGWNPL